MDSDAITDRQLDSLSEEGERVFRQLCEDRQRQTVTFARSVSSRGAQPDGVRAPSMFSPPRQSYTGGSSRGHYQPGAAPRTLSWARPTSAPSAFHSLVHPAHLPVPSDSGSEAALRHVLQRQGVVDSMMTEDVLHMAQSQVGPSGFESYWTAHAATLLKSSQVGSYYEGLCLSLLLDSAADPAVWMQVAARRWVSLNLVADGVSWDTARGLLPMTGMGNIPASLMTELFKAAKMRNDIMPKRQSAYPSSSRNGQSDNNRGKNNNHSNNNNNNNKNGHGGAGGSARSNEAVASAKKDKNKRSRRNSVGGAGAPADAASAGSG